MYQLKSQHSLDTYGYNQDFTIKLYIFIDSSNLTLQYSSPNVSSFCSIVQHGVLQRDALSSRSGEGALGGIEPRPDGCQSGTLTFQLCCPYSATVA